MPRTSKASTNEHQPTTDTSSPLEREEGNPDIEGQVAFSIATRYYGCIAEIAPAIAHEFWNRLDEAVAAEIIKQRPSRSNSTAPKFLDGLEADIAQVDVTTRAIASQGGAI